ncbi:MAG: hypothetical protein CMO98_00970 [Woeseia sp.]|nr:hypothetical protein [Woeseia sp.]
MVKLVTSSVVRGSHQGESHGGVYLIDLERKLVHQAIDWNIVTIDWHGNGLDRGLRGIAFDNDRVYIAASDQLLAYTPEFELIDSWRNPFLKYCHEISVWERSLFLTSTGYDSILGFDMDECRFNWAMHIETANYRFKAKRFDPTSDDGPMMLNKMHINNVYCSSHGMYISGLRTGGMLHFNGTDINMAVEMPPGTHNAQPFRDGVLFNDSNDDVLRYTGRGEGEEDRAMRVPTYDVAKLQFSGAVESQIARPGFARGLCVLSDHVVAGGSSPSTITVYDLAANEMVVSVNLSMDVRNSVHGLEVWPYD